MKKLLIFLSALALMTLAACGGSSSQADFDPSELADALRDSGCFTDLLSEMDEATALELYGIDPESVERCKVYLGTGATAEEIAVVECTDKDAASAAAEAFDKRVESQIKAYENYVPSELTKLDKAIVRSSGNYAVYVTAADADGAGAIVDEYMK